MLKGVELQNFLPCRLASRLSRDGICSCLGLNSSGFFPKLWIAVHCFVLLMRSQAPSVQESNPLGIASYSLKSREFSWQECPINHILVQTSVRWQSRRDEGSRELPGGTYMETWVGNILSIVLYDWNYRTPVSVLIVFWSSRPSGRCGRALSLLSKVVCWIMMTEGRLSSLRLWSALTTWSS